MWLCSLGRSGALRRPAQCPLLDFWLPAGHPLRQRPRCAADLLCPSVAGGQGSEHRTGRSWELWRVCKRVQFQSIKLSSHRCSDKALECVGTSRPSPSEQNHRLLHHLLGFAHLLLSGSCLLSHAASGCKERFVNLFASFRLRWRQWNT